MDEDEVREDEVDVDDSGNEKENENGNRRTVLNVMGHGLRVL